MSKRRQPRPAPRDAGEALASIPAEGLERGSPSGTADATAGEPILVAGIGASAGGLEAYTELLEHLPPDTGMAYVLVQHLDPTHESLLAELLARVAPIPVRQVTDGVRVEPDHAYVIPPNASMILIGGQLQLVPREGAAHPPAPIDCFFESLAEANESRAVGVVLSGTASDGAAGVQAIKAAGGITFAEEPASAQYDGMPRAAIATGCVDFVLRPPAIAAQLARLGRHPYMRGHEVEAAGEEEPAERASAPSTSELPREIFRILKRHAGIDFSQYKQGTLTRRVRRRMLLTHTEMLPDYLALLEREPAEVDTLCRDLLICVTGFFRDPEAFAALARIGFPAMLQPQRPAAPVRVWVPGCATGEEAYSIAICLLEALGDRLHSAPPQIFGTDVSAAAIATARTGRYPASIETDVSPERLARFFVKEERGYRVSEAVRNLCVFAVQNVTSDPPFSHLDLVSCRNVLIYLQADLQTKVLALFHYALVPTGILLLGAAESAGPSSALFAPLDKKHRLFTRIAARHHLPSLTAPPSATLPPALPAAGERRDPSSVALEREADQIVLAHYGSAGVVVDDHLAIVQFRGATSGYLAPVPGVASFQLLKMIRPELRAELQTALRAARSSAGPASARAVAFHDGDVLRSVNLEVLPFKVVGSDERFCVVLFEPVDAGDNAGAAPQPASRSRRAGSARAAPRGDARLVGELRQELAAMERHLRATSDEHEAGLEELRAANEEIQSSNEELRSTNEELETAKEELQSVNEELTTLNTELRDRNSDLGALNDDLGNLLASIQVPVIIVGSDLRIRRYTAGAERLVNVIPSDVGRALGDITPKIDTPDLVALARQVMETLGGVEREVRDDAGHWYALRIRPYKTTAQKIDGAVMVFQDIDERRRHELALDEARRYAEAIVDTVREPLVVLDGALRVRSANRAFYDTFHLSAPETERRSFFDLGDGLWNTPRLRALLEDVLPAQSSVESFEVEHAFRTIGHRILRLNARELHLNHGSARLILLAIEDVTERRRLEQRTHFLAETGVALGASVDYDAVLESITRLAVPTLADWCLVDIEDVNGALRRVAVSGPDPAGAERARRIAAAGAAADHPLSQVLRTAEPMVVDEAPAAMVDGLLGAAGHVARTPVPPARSLAIVPLRAGTRVRGVITFVAATAARRFMPGDLELAREFARRAALALENATLYREAETARAAAEAANRSKVDFLATMSHELRTPLNAILGYAQLLQMDIHGALTDAQRRAVHRIEAGQRHLTDLINDVLHFAKLEAGHVHVTITDVPVQPMLAEIDDLISAQMRRRQLHYERRACDPGIAVRAEEGRVRQIVLNLLSNAAKFTGAGGSVVLSCDFDEHSVRIRITDSGIGIAEEKRSVIFEPFVQLDSGLTRTAEGTGLGLAISRDLARAMYGDLEVTGAEGGGSTFTLTLPRARVLEQ